MIRAAAVSTTRKAIHPSIHKGNIIRQHRGIAESFRGLLSLSDNAATVGFYEITLRNQSTSAKDAIHNARYGTSKGEDEEHVLSMPSNLTIDPSSTISPFFGLNKVSSQVYEEELEEEEEDDDVVSESSNDETDDPKEDNLVAEKDDDDYEEEEILYSLQNTPLTEPNYVIPLPKRLHVPIFSLYPDKNIRNEDDDSVDIEPKPMEVGTIHLPPYLFGQDPIRIDILHRCVIYQRNKKRGKRFPAITKTISTKSGSGKKMRPQKGSGRARAGHKRAAHWRGGAKAHGPKGAVQDYTTKLNKKVRKMGLRHALSQKLKEGNLILINEMRGPSIKTRELSAALELFDIGGKKAEVGATALILDEPEDEEESVGGVHAVLRLASRNLHKIKVLNQMQANVYDILKYDKLMVSLSALQALEDRLPE